MTDLKPCPFCGQHNQPKDAERMASCSGCISDNGLVYPDIWNSRPIEDRLRAALEKLVNALDRCNPAIADLTFFKANHIPGYKYTGPTFHEELHAARVVLEMEGTTSQMVKAEALK